MHEIRKYIFKTSINLIRGKSQSTTKLTKVNRLIEMKFSWWKVSRAMNVVALFISLIAFWIFQLIFQRIYRTIESLSGYGYALLFPRRLC